MFLHIVAVDRQLSVHTAEGEPLSAALDEAFQFHGRQRTPALVATTEDGKVLDPAKSAEENGLSDNILVRVLPAEKRPAPTVEEQAVATAKVARKRVRSAPRTEPTIDQIMGRRPRKK